MIVCIVCIALHTAFCINAHLCSGELHTCVAPAGQTQRTFYFFFIFSRFQQIHCLAMIHILEVLASNAAAGWPTRAFARTFLSAASLLWTKKNLVSIIWSKVWSPFLLHPLNQPWKTDQHNKQINASKCQSILVNEVLTGNRLIRSMIHPLHDISVSPTQIMARQGLVHTLVEYLWVINMHCCDRNVWTFNWNSWSPDFKCH